MRGGPCGARSNPPGEVVQTAHRLQDYPRRLHTRPSIRPRSMKPAGLGSVVRAVRQTGQKICRRWHHWDGRIVDERQIVQREQARKPPTAAMPTIDQRTPAPRVKRPEAVHRRLLSRQKHYLKAAASVEPGVEAVLQTCCVSFRQFSNVSDVGLRSA